MTLDLNAEPDLETSEEVPAFDASQLIISPPMPRYAWRRRASIVDCLDSYEEVVRYRRRVMTEAQHVAVWEASWQLRMDVVAALDRCEGAEQAARWVRDE